MNENIALDKLAFGSRLNSIRRAKGMTSEQLSELCGVDNTHIRHIECGNRSPSIGLLVKICNVFQASPYYFLQDSIKLGKEEKYLDCLSFILNYQLKRLPLSKT